MICTRNQTVRLTDTALLLATGPLTHKEAKVVSVIETDGEPGTRRVHLDRHLAGERWWVESDLEAAP